MDFLFNETIDGWDSWGRLFCSREAFEPLVRHILKREGLRHMDSLENCEPGTNAVFKCGEFVVKIFVPIQSGLDTLPDYRAELFGMERALSLGIPATRVVAKGEMDDKYLFRYIVMNHIRGRMFGEACDGMTQSEKMSFGQRLRAITDKLNTPCPPFNSVEVFEREKRNPRWDIMPSSFNEERLAYIDGLRGRERVYVHGDLNPDNIILGEDGELYLIDFADALLAPAEYELPCVLCELFEFEKPFIDGYFGAEDKMLIARHCLDGILMHDFGSGIITHNLGKAEQIKSIKALNELLYARMGLI